MIVIGVPVPKDHSIDIRVAAYCMSEVREGVKWGYCASKECGVGRSTFAFSALQDPGVTHILNIDSDVVPPPGTLQKLLDHDLPIVAGMYPTVVGEKKTWSFKTDGGWCERTHVFADLNTLMRVNAIGGSTVLIKREVFERLEQPWFRATYNITNGDYTEKEDEYFSRKAQEAGYELYVDPSIVCKHFNYGEI